MRHRKHNHLLGVKTAHRTSLIANLSCSLIDNGRITTTLAKARALRPSIEKAITLAKKAHASDDAANKVHYRRLAIARLRSQKAVKKLFDELVEQFVGRNGGYTRIYKLAIPRLGDAADMAIIEFVEEIQKKNPKKKRTTKKAKEKLEASSVVEEKIAPTAAKDESIEEVSGKESEPKKAKKKSSKTKAEDKEPE
jgi:large subunit ribosomal protein L17